MIYNEEQFLKLSGLQHYLFCRRQWALIHIEQQWDENYRTVDGQIMHKKAHDVGNNTRRDDVLTVRAMKIHSSKLGISGECDIVEFHKSPDGVELQRVEGRWIPYPVEYKRGTSKNGPYDEAQLCAQAMCLEEMLCCDIHEGALYYGEDRHRQKIEFTSELRSIVIDSLKEMHQYYERGYTPKVKPTKACNACSLKNLCLPKLMKTESVASYLKKSLGE